MERKTEDRLTLFLFCIIMFGSLAGMILPLMNPSAYSDLMPGIYPIPMVKYEEPMTCTIPQYVVDIETTDNLCEDVLV